MPTLDVGQVADAVGGVAGEAELGRGVPYQDSTGYGGEAGGGSRDVPGEDDAIVEAGVVEEPVRRLRRGPILTGQRQRSADRGGIESTLTKGKP